MKIGVGAREGRKTSVCAEEMPSRREEAIAGRIKGVANEMKRGTVM